MHNHYLYKNKEENLMLDVKNLDIDYQLKSEELIKELLFLQQYDKISAREEDIDDLDSLDNDERGFIC